MQVSKKLGLKPMPKGASLNQRRRALVERIDHLERLLKRGGMSPKLTQRCEEYIRVSEYRIRQLDKRKTDPTKIKINMGSAKKAKQPVRERQGFLPNFLGQLDNARIEELVAEKIFKHLAHQVDAAVSNIFKKVSNE